MKLVHGAAALKPSFAGNVIFWSLTAALAWPIYLVEMAIVAAIGGAR
jgi:hypothetical protein